MHSHVCALGLPLDLLTVNETAQDPPPDEPENINGMQALSQEATFVNQNFAVRAAPRTSLYLCLQFCASLGLARAACCVVCMLTSVRLCVRACRARRRSRCRSLTRSSRRERQWPRSAMSTAAGASAIQSYACLPVV